MKLQLAVVLCVVLLASRVNSEEELALKTYKDKLSYSMGLDIGRGLKRQSIDVDPEIMARGLRDAFANGKPLLTDSEIRKIKEEFQKELTARHQEQSKIIVEKNKKEGEEFLAENKKKKDVVTLPSGLQYRIITEGTGKIPKANDTVVVNYRGTLIDGTEFDSSYRRGEPATFTVSGIIPGWVEALQLMKEGSKWQLFVPSNLAYGERGTEGIIGPNATLIFEVELISIK